MLAQSRGRGLCGSVLHACERALAHTGVPLLRACMHCFPPPARMVAHNLRAAHATQRLLLSPCCPARMVAHEQAGCGTRNVHIPLSIAATTSVMAP